MSLSINKQGTITLYQGDSGEIVVSGLDTSKNYMVYFAILDAKENLIANELQVASNKSDFVVFSLTADFTDLLKVPKGKNYALYTYGIKVCDTETKTEDTLIVEGSNYGDKNLIIVYPRKVIGI